jgi:TRAP-type transport system small permease protein
LSRLVRAVRHLADGVCAALLCAIAALAFFQVVARYLLGLSTPWSEELLRLLFIWLVLMGAARASHMRIDLAERAAGARGRRLLVAAGAALGAALLVLMIVQGLDLVELTAYDRYTALPLSVQWSYWAVVAGCGLWLLFLAFDTAQSLLGRD